MAMYIGLSKKHIENYESALSFYLLPTNLYRNTIRISEDIFSFMANTKILLEWPIKFPPIEIQMFLDSLLNTYGENWLKYLDPFNQFGIHHLKMNGDMNEKVSGLFIGIENEQQFFQNIGLSRNQKLLYSIKALKDFLFNKQNPLLWKNYIKITKNFLSIYNGLEKIDVSDLITTQPKKCDSSNHKIIENVLKFWEKNKNLLRNTVFHLLQKHLHFEFPANDIAKRWISEFFCIILESSNEDFKINLYGFLGTRLEFFQHDIIKVIVKIGNGKKDEKFAKSIKIWSAILEGYKQLEIMKANGENKMEIVSFVESQLENIIKSFGEKWTSVLNPFNHYMFSFDYSFSDSYFITKVANSLVKANNAYEFNSKMNFQHYAAENSQIIFNILENLVKHDLGNIWDSANEFENLIIQFNHTKVMKNLIEMH
ncbi:unnamed protein product [Dimorphilus gyrociliatus]|uniref:Uncharacterized protein n=1 Tax=Dimorphilus gyrociliatus TaxID=2664684 RepID=A0A7I8WDI8_9ANNE|nr:unnamed protein product [Dimorphilus gyrociliatus]